MRLTGHLSVNDIATKLRQNEIKGEFSRASVRGRLPTEQYL